MATAATIIKRAMRLIGAIQTGEEPTAQEMTDGLEALNAMMRSWNLNGLTVYQVYEETVSWTGGQQSRTIGSGGNFDTTRPTRLLDGFTRINGVDYPYRAIEKQEYDAHTSKTVTGTYPEGIYYENSMSLGKLWAYPVPVSTVEVHLNTWKQFQAFTTADTTVSLPDGYERAMAYNLAIEFATEFSVSVPELVLKIANDSKADIESFNIKPIIAGIEFAAGKPFNIYAGS